MVVDSMRLHVLLLVLGLQIPITQSTPGKLYQKGEYGRGIVLV